MNDQKYAWILAGKVSDLAGVRFDQKHQELICTRLLNRARDLGFSSIKEYYDYTRHHLAAEIEHLIAILTTHHTYFFREFEHFNFLRDQGLQNIVAGMKSENRSELNVWSSACSYGHEVYSLAMFLHHHLQEIDPSIKFKILGSDVAMEPLQVAKNGVFPWAQLKESPSFYLKNHWAMGKGRTNGFVRAGKSLKDVCEFKLVNLNRISEQSAQNKFDIIFCRNVFIYFDPENVSIISKKLFNRLTDHGYLFLGLTENIFNLDAKYRSYGHSIYSVERKKTANETSKPFAVKQADSPLDSSKEIKILCVDDSPTVLTILKRIFANERRFKVVGTAGDGLEARKFLDSNAVDIITLDIHMPNQNGVEFLEQNNDLPPTVIISSVSREDNHLGSRALALGAVDYIEKPTLKNFSQKKNEILSKVEIAFCLSSSSVKSNLSFKQVREVINAAEKLKILCASRGDISRLAPVFDDPLQEEPPMIIAIEGLNEMGQSLFDELQRISGRNLIRGDTKSIHLSTNVTTVVDFMELKEAQNQLKTFNRVCIGITGTARELDLQWIKDIENAIIVEEEINISDLVKSSVYKVTQVVPIAGIGYEMNKLLGEELEREEKRNEQYLEAKELKYNLREVASGSFNANQKKALSAFKEFRVDADEVLLRFYEPLSKKVGCVVLLADDRRRFRVALSDFVNRLSNVKGLFSLNFEVKGICGKGTSVEMVLEICNELEISVFRLMSLTDAPGIARVDLSTGRMQVKRKALSSSNMLGPKQENDLKVLIVDDSRSIRKLLRKIIESDSRCHVVAEAELPSQVEPLIKKFKPDVMTLDIHMPEMTGSELLRRIFPIYQIPTVVVSSLKPEEGGEVFRALEYGAFDYVQKPSLSEFDSSGKAILEKIRLATMVEVRPSNVKPVVSIDRAPSFPSDSVIFVGASTGGTEALKALFSTFPISIPPVIVGLHIPPHFSAAFAESMDDIFSFSVKEAREGEVIRPNSIYIAPGGFQCRVRRSTGQGLCIEIKDQESPNHFKPCVDFLFESAAQTVGKKAIGVILTGMGTDGAKGMGLMKTAGAVTIAQDEESSVVYGMPKAAVDTGAALYQTSLTKISFKIYNHFKKQAQSVA